MAQDVDRLLGETVNRPRSLKPPVGHVTFSERLRSWSRSQVAAYRVGLVLLYIGMIYFGTQAFVAGVPAFVFTAPEGWTPVWSSIVIAGGLIGAIGALRAGEEPATKEILVYNRIELVGAIALFLTLGTYAAVLLILGYYFGDENRVAVGSGFVALGIHPAVRMVWLIFRPTKVESTTTTTAPTSTVAPGPSEK